MSQFTGRAGAFAGIPQATNDAYPTIALGTVMEGSDGTAFRYVRAGSSALAAGNVLQEAAEDTGEQNVAVAAAAIGATSIVTTTTLTVTKNQYAGGYAVVTTSAGVGYKYRIKSHEAYTAAASTFVLEDPLQVALTTGSRLDFVANPFNAVIPAATSPSGTIVGVAVGTISASQYGWAQIRGTCGVLNDAAGAITVGTAVMPSTSVAGSLRAFTGAAYYLGVARTGIAASEVGLVDLKIS